MINQAKSDLGSWEKHTKGIGLKLLKKFGFNGRLGANEDGISTSVEVKVRPNGLGLGFGDFKEQSALKSKQFILSFLTLILCLFSKNSIPSFPRQ